jgi:hypothetical protein
MQRKLQLTPTVSRPTHQLVDHRCYTCCCAQTVGTELLVPSCARYVRQHCTWSRLGSRSPPPLLVALGRYQGTPLAPAPPPAVPSGRPAYLHPVHNAPGRASSDQPRSRTAAWRLASSPGPRAGSAWRSRGRRWCHRERRGGRWPRLNFSGRSVGMSLARRRAYFCSSWRA